MSIQGAGNQVPQSAPQSVPEAVIVAGGFGTRLLPLTANRPKHLLEALNGLSGYWVAEDE